MLRVINRGFVRFFPNLKVEDYFQIVISSIATSVEQDTNVPNQNLLRKFFFLDFYIIMGACCGM